MSCVAVVEKKIEGNWTKVKCGKETELGYRYCEDHKNRPKAVDERENNTIGTVIDATQAFEGTVETTSGYSPAKPEGRALAVPREQQNIYQKATESLERAIDWEEETWQRVRALGADWRYEDKNGTEQMRSELGVHERAMDRVIRATTALAKLSVEAQSVNVNKVLQETIKGVMMRVLQRMGLSSEQIDQARLMIAEEFQKVNKEENTG